jgi:hypothetical protein
MEALAERPQFIDIDSCQSTLEPGATLVAHFPPMRWLFMVSALPNLWPFPFGILYVLAMAAYVALSLPVIVVGLLLTIWPLCRRVGLSLVGGMVGSLPFVLFFQWLSYPIIWATFVLLAAWPGPGSIIVAQMGLGLIVGTFVAASATGCIAGWRIGARVALGARLRDALRASRALRLLAAALNRIWPAPNAVMPERGVAIGLGLIMFVVGGLTVARLIYVETFGTAEIDYRGEKVRLAKKYVDYDDYKNDPYNLATSEIPRVERMMTEARIGSDFEDWKDFVAKASTIRFPGYGMGPRPRVAAGGREFIVEVMEIPQAAKDRYFVLEKTNGKALRLVDDFVITSRRFAMKSKGYIRLIGLRVVAIILGRPSEFLEHTISSVRLVNDRLVYSDRDANVVRETHVPLHQ